MKLTLIRTDLLPGKTYGLLDLDGVFQCHVLEDEDRHLETNPTGKVYGETAIPRGTYPVVLDFSHRFKRTLPHVLGVPGFDGIRIHPGNTAADTHGCLLVGKHRVPAGITDSRVAFDALMVQLKAAKDKITLEVK